MIFNKMIKMKYNYLVAEAVLHAITINERITPKNPFKLITIERTNN